MTEKELDELIELKKAQAKAKENMKRIKKAMTLDYFEEK